MLTIWSLSLVADVRGERREIGGEGGRRKGREGGREEREGREGGREERE